MKAAAGCDGAPQQVGGVASGHPEIAWIRLRDFEKRRIELDSVVGLAQQHLGPDVAFIAELTPEGLVYRAVAGDAAAFNIALEGEPLKGPTYAQRLVAGEIPKVICDARADPRVAHLPITESAGIGSYIGVPLRLSDDTLYGVFCCASHAPDPELGERDVRFMSLLGELIVHNLDELSDQQRLRAGILSLIEFESLKVAFQPIIDLRTNKTVGVEALARFPEPYARPDQTFAAAEEFGLGLELEELVVRRAWGVLERLGHGQFLALNLTPGSLLALARRANQREEVPLSALVVEITEHAAINRYADLRCELDRLRERGLRIAVDDAGAGYASLRHVLELRPDIIKLDRSLIHGLANDRARALVVSAFVSLAGDLGSTVVAEGVELPADLEAIRELGLHAAQGYLLGRPSTDPADLAGWLQPQPQVDQQAA
jgi:EAL domain-containing protein (putative c-di-GMP-specific phosphodiesterase class I)